MVMSGGHYQLLCYLKCTKKQNIWDVRYNYHVCQRLSDDERCQSNITCVKGRKMFCSGIFLKCGVAFITIFLSTAYQQNVFVAERPFLPGCFVVSV